MYLVYMPTVEKLNFLRQALISQNEDASQYLLPVGLLAMKFISKWPFAKVIRKESSTAFLPVWNHTQFKETTTLDAEQIVLPNQEYKSINERIQQYHEAGDIEIICSVVQLRIHLFIVVYKLSSQNSALILYDKNQPPKQIEFSLEKCKLVHFSNVGDWVKK